MNMTRNLLIATVALWWLPADNHTVAERYPRSQDDGSAAVEGNVIAANGASTSGDVLLAPQDATDLPPPECNIATQSPCNEKCEADYEAAAIECGKINDEAQRKACQENAHTKYRNCLESCQRTANKDCDDKYQDCVDNGPTSCLKKSGGKTLCQRCWERCNAGDSPSGECRRCKF